MEKHLDDRLLVEGVLPGQADRIDADDVAVAAGADERAERGDLRVSLGESVCDRIQPLAEERLVHCHRR